MRFKRVIALVGVVALVIAVVEITRGWRKPVEIRLGPIITVAQVHVGNFGDAILLAPDGTVWGWGLNRGALLGPPGRRSASEHPYRLDVGSNWVTLAPSHTYSIGIKRDGTLWGWSFNPTIGLGGFPIIGTYTNPPTWLAAGSNWVAVATGGAHSLALRSDGALFAWGLNTHGQVGDGTTNTVIQPVEVGPNRSWVSIAADFLASAGIQSDGSLWQWGFAQSGYADRPEVLLREPTRVGLDSDWQSVQGVLGSFLARRADGSLWVWGPNAESLGSTNCLHPHPLDLEDTFRVIGIGGAEWYLQKPDGSIWLTHPTGRSLTTPSPTVGAHQFALAGFGVPGVGAGLDKDGTLWTWGTRLGIQTERPWANTVNQLAAKLGVRSINIPVVKAPPVETDPWPIARFITNQTARAEVERPSR